MKKVTDHAQIKYYDSLAQITYQVPGQPGYSLDSVSPSLPIFLLFSLFLQVEISLVQGEKESSYIYISFSRSTKFQQLCPPCCTQIIFLLMLQENCTGPVVRQFHRNWSGRTQSTQSVQVLTSFLHCLPEPEVLLMKTACMLLLFLNWYAPISF